jgi:hypothetical protein
VPSLGFGPDPPAMVFDDVFADGQPKTCAIGFSMREKRHE